MVGAAARMTHRLENSSILMGMCARVDYSFVSDE
jgi:hypothetical protein